MKKIVLSSLSSIILFSGSAFASDYKTRYVTWIHHFPQERINWCTYATSQMWIQHLTGKKIPQWKIRAYNHWRDGMDHSQFRKTMKHYTGKGFQSRWFKGRSGIYYSKKRIYKELIKQHRPLEISGVTSKKLDDYGHFEYIPNQHSMIIWAARIKPKKGHYYLDYVKILDPVYHSAFSIENGGEYEAVSYNHKVTYADLYEKHGGGLWRVNQDDWRYAIED